jgi:RecB family exonuclease
MARKTHEEIEALKKKLNTSRIWSFSRINAFINCSYSYYMKYVKREKEKENNIYGLLGGQFHDILEKFYKKEISYEQMIEDAEIAIINVSVLEMKFDKNDSQKNEGIENKYFECMKHFFMNHVPVQSKVLCEKEIVIKIGNHYFQGYIDAIHREGDTYIITDYKSSTIYAGKKILQEGRQLMLYALGLHQQGIPVDKIKIRWNFLKYNALTFTQKNGKVKTMNAERFAWAGKLKSQLRMNLKDTKQSTEDEIEGLLTQCMELNSIHILPKEIQDKYQFADCYVEIPLDEETLANLEKEFTATILDIYKREKDFEDTKNLDLWKKEVDVGCFYFCSNICGYTAGQCHCYREFLSNADIFKSDNNKRIQAKDDVGDDDAWMRELGLI